MCCLVVQVFVCVCAGFKKKNFKKSYEIKKKAAQKIEVFVQNMFFRQAVFSL